MHWNFESGELICANNTNMSFGMAKLRTVETPEKVVNLLGVETICELCEANAKQVWHWYGRAGMFPANTYVVVKRALRRRGYNAPDYLWNMKGVKRAA